LKDNNRENDLKTGKVRKYAVRFLPAFIIALFTAACLYVILIRFGPHHLTAAFHQDEGFAVRKSFEILRSGFVSTGGFLDWGPLYLYLQSFIFGAAELAAGAIRFDINAYADYDPYILLSRFVNLAAAVGYLIVLYRVISEHYGKRAAALALLIFATVPIHIQVTAKVRPDTLNMLFVLASLLCVIVSGSGKKRYLYLAAVFAALSFGVKYTGATLIPFIWLASVNLDLKKNGSGKEKTLRAVKSIVFLTLTFIAVATVTAPVYVIEPLTSLRGLLHLREILKQGTSVRGPANPLYWLPVLLRPHNGGPILPAVFVLFALGAGVKAIKERKGTVVREFFLDPKVLPFIWALLYAAMFILTVRLRASRYVIPILPFYALSAGLAVTYVYDRVRRAPWRTVVVAATSAIVLINAFYVYKMFKAYDYAMDRSRAVYSWLAETVPPGETVGRSYRAYVPYDVFETVEVNSETDLAAAGPAAYVLNYRILEEFGGTDLADLFLRGKERFTETHELVKDSFAGSVKGYYFAADFGLFFIFAREDIGPGYAVDYEAVKLDETPTLRNVLTSDEDRYERQFFGVPYAYRIYLE
jgi:4-amino-4-deoxy-L-arabinose transferase-like glycosyltransferase